MYMETTKLRELLDDNKYIDFLEISTISNSKYSINNSNKEDFIVEGITIERILEILKGINTDYYISSELEYFSDVRFIINREQLIDVNDFYITFKDGTKYENSYENKTIMIEEYQLPLNLFSEENIY